MGTESYCCVQRRYGVVFMEGFVRITLIRHGRPEFELVGNVRANELKYMIHAYNLSGIVDVPPEKAINLVHSHKVVICSDLPRSLHSAKLMGVSDVYVSSGLYQETKIPYFSYFPIKLSVNGWLVLLRGLWCLGFSKNGESLLATKHRAREAAQSLIQLAEQFDSVLLVGHGFINYFIAKELRKNKWSGPKQPGKNYWQFSSYYPDTL